SVDTPDRPACCEAHTAGVVAVAAVVGLKPPWNHPHVTWCAFRRWPVLWPVTMVTCDAVAIVQSSSAADGRGSPMIVPICVVGSMAVTLPDALPRVSIAPHVCPATRFSAPGVDGPNPVLNESSLIAKC